MVFKYVCIWFVFPVTQGVFGYEEHGNKIIQTKLCYDVISDGILM